MNSPITTEETHHISNILKHYARALENALHSYCDEYATWDAELDIQVFDTKNHACGLVLSCPPCASAATQTPTQTQGEPQ